MSFGVRIAPEPLRSIGFASISGTYAAIGASPALTHIACIIKITNNTNGDLTISWDGSTDHDFVPAGSFVLYDISANTGREQGLYIPIGTKFYVKGTPGSGSCYLTVLYPFVGNPT